MTRPPDATTCQCCGRLAPEVICSLCGTPRASYLRVLALLSNPKEKAK